MSEFPRITSVPSHPRFLYHLHNVSNCEQRHARLSCTCVYAWCVMRIDVVTRHYTMTCCQAGELMFVVVVPPLQHAFPPIKLNNVSSLMRILWWNYGGVPGISVFVISFFFLFWLPQCFCVLRAGRLRARASGSISHLIGVSAAAPMPPPLGSASTHT